MAVAGGILVTLQQEVQCFAVAVASQRPLPPHRRGTYDAASWCVSIARGALKHLKLCCQMPEVLGSYCYGWCLAASITRARKSVQLFPRACLAAVAAESLPSCSATSAVPECPGSLQHSFNLADQY